METSGGTKTVADSIRERLDKLPSIERKVVVFSERNRESEEAVKDAEVRREGERDYYHLRKHWSWMIFGFMAFIILLQFLILIAVGVGWIIFVDEMKWLPYAIVVDDFLKIVGLCFIVVSFLFPNIKNK